MRSGSAAPLRHSRLCNAVLDGSVRFCSTRQILPRHCLSSHNSPSRRDVFNSTALLPCRQEGRQNSIPCLHATPGLEPHLPAAAPTPAHTRPSRPDQLFYWLEGGELRLVHEEKRGGGDRSVCAAAAQTAEAETRTQHLLHPLHHVFKM